MSANKARDTRMPSAQDTARDNPMRPPADSPRTAAEALLTFALHPSALILASVSLAGLLWRVRMGPLGWADAVLAVVLWAVFPFIEWLIHVHMLHFRPRRIGRFTLDFYLPKTHRRHHADPWNLDWVFVPRHVHGLVLAAMAVSLWLAGEWRPLLMSAFVVFLLQGLHYEWVHYLSHISWRPRVAYCERRVLAHRWHHFRNETLWWGVSRGWADQVLHTAPDARDVARTDTTTDLGIKH